MIDWQPSARADMLRMRAATIRRVHDFMAERETLEVSTPVISSAGVTEPQIESLALDQAQGFLRTSPEYFHKRLLAADVGDLYEIGPVFRGGERGELHREEFTLLEWYRIQRNWQQMAEETLELIKACTPKDHPGWQQRTVSWSESFAERLGFDPLLESLDRDGAAAGVSFDQRPAEPHVFGGDVERTRFERACRL